MIAIVANNFLSVLAKFLAISFSVYQSLTFFVIFIRTDDHLLSVTLFSFLFRIFLYFDLMLFLIIFSLVFSNSLTNFSQGKSHIYPPSKHSKDVIVFDVAHGLWNISCAHFFYLFFFFRTKLRLLLFCHLLFSHFLYTR